MGKENPAYVMKTPQFIEVDGFRLPPTFDPETFRAVTKYRPGKEDVIVVTFPKCGTTWMMQIALLILKKGEPPLTAEEYFASNLFMEMTKVQDLKDMPRPGILKSHLPYDRVTFSPEAKYIYVARHPADCLISFFHHVRYFPIYRFSDGSLDEFFEIFIEGKTDFGDYFQHLLSWYEHKDEPNVFFTTYESMKADPRGTVLKLAEFLGKEYYESLLANNGEILEKVLENSSLEYMKKTTNKYWNDFFSGDVPIEAQEKNKVLKNYSQLSMEAAKEGHFSIGDFVRRGAVGEGKLTLSTEQINRLNCRMQEIFSGTDIMKLWNK